MADIYGVPCAVQQVRVFDSGRALGVGCPNSSPLRFFVYDREDVDTKWHMHCGPYSTFDDAKEWVDAIRDDSHVDH